MEDEEVEIVVDGKRYLFRMPADTLIEFIEAVRRGQVSVFRPFKPRQFDTKSS